MDLYGFIQVYMDLFGLIIKGLSWLYEGLINHQQALFCGVRCGVGWIPLRRQQRPRRHSVTGNRPADGGSQWNPSMIIGYAETRSISPKRWLVKLSNSLHWRRETNHKYRKGHFYKSNIILCIYSIWLYIYLFIYIYIYIISNPQNDRKETCHRNLLGPRCC